MTDEQDGQLLLPFDIEEVKIIDWSRLPHFSTPTNDNECLLEFQYQYRAEGKTEALNNIYMLGKEVCLKLINKEVKTNKKLKLLSVEEREEKAHNAASYVVCQITKDREWFIKSSFTGYLYLRVKHELYYHRKVDKIVQFVNWDDFMNRY